MDRKNFMPHQTQPEKPKVELAEMSEEVLEVELSEEDLEGIAGGISISPATRRVLQRAKTSASTRAAIGPDVRRFLELRAASSD